ncbi:MAG: BACON domain-containing protein [Bacteroidales bacterium]|nr:BACON domain-containing protein [Bacteroidales bacterium]
MKLRNLFMAVIAGAALLVGCNKEVDLGPAKLDVSTSAVSFDAAEASQEISFTATRDWVVSGLPDWIALSAEAGVASPDPQKLVIDVTENTGFTRTAEIVITIGYARSVITVSQTGPEGEYVTPTITIAEFITTDGTTEYIVSGKITSVSMDYKYAYISDGTGEVEVYQPSNWADFADKLKVGLVLTAQGVYTKYTNASGRTYDELVGVILSVEEAPNDGGEETTDESLQPASETNIAGLVAKISKSSNSSNKSAYDGITLTGATVTYVNGNNAYLEDASGAVLLYLNDHGFVAGDVITGAVSGEGYYYNGLPEIVSLGEAYTKTSGTAPAPTEITIEKLLSTYTSQLSRYLIIKGITVTEGLSGRNAVISQGDQSINVYTGLSSGLTLEANATGDITVFPTLYNTTKQVTFWDNSHFTGNGGGSDTPGGDTPTPGTHDGLTLETAFTASEAAAWVMANLEHNTVSPAKYYVKGVIEHFYASSGVDQNFTNNSYHQASFYLTDDGNATDAYEFEAYQVNYLDGVTFDPATHTDVVKGDKVVVYGPLKRYNQIAETDGKGAAYVYSINADGGTDTPGGGDVTPGAAGTYTFQFSDISGLTGWPTKAAEATAASTQKYTLNGVDYTFTLSPNIYTSTYSGSSYLMLASKTNSGPVYLGLPAIEGCALVSVTATVRDGASKSAKGLIASDLQGTVVKGGEEKTLDYSDGTMSYTWTLSETEAGKVYYYSSSAAGYNSQVVELKLVYSDGNGGGTDTPGGGDEPVVSDLPKHEGTEADPFTVEDAIYVAKNATEAKEYFVKAVVGKDVSIKGGVASFELIDGTTDGKLTVVKAKSFGGEAFADDAPLEWLDEVVMKGKVTEYSTLPALLDGQLVKWNDKTSFTEPTTPANDGLTLETAFTASEANAWVLANLAHNQNTGETKYYVKGKVYKYYQSSGKDQNFATNSYHQATFFISDDGAEAAANFEAYQINYLEGKTWAEGQTDVVVGDEVVLYGPLARYNTTAETQGGGKAYLYSLNGVTTAPATGGGDTPGGDTTGPVTIDFSTLGYENSVQYLETKSGDVTVTFGGGANDGKYYNTGTAMRIYGGGYCEVSSAKAITKIVYTFSDTNYAPTSADVVNVGTYDVASSTWTGSAAAVKITRPSGSGHWRLQKVEVTF